MSMLILAVSLERNIRDYSAEQPILLSIENYEFFLFKQFFRKIDFSVSVSIWLGISFLIFYLTWCGTTKFSLIHYCYFDLRVVSISTCYSCWKPSNDMISIIFVLVFLLLCSAVYEVQRRMMLAKTYKLRVN